MTRSTPRTLDRRGFLAGSGAAAASLLTPGPGAAQRDRTDAGRADGTDATQDAGSAIAERVRESLDEHDVPGAAVAVVRDGEVTTTAGFGVADRESGRPVEATTPFRVGSVSKPVVWTAVARLVTRDGLDPEAPVSRYLPEGLPWWDDPVSLADLATHTAGFEPSNRELWYPDPADVGSLSAHLEAAAPAQVRPPGKVGSYSNHGAGLAGQVLASAVGEPFPAAMASTLLEPAGMATSSFEQPLPDALHEAHATGHDAATVDGKYLGVGIAPAGALSASAADMARFMQLHLNDGVVDGEGVLAPETVELLHRQWFTHHEELAGSTLGFVEDHRGDVRVLRHNGATQSFHSHLVLAPERGFGLFVAYNSDRAAEPREAVPEAVLEDLFPAPEPDVPEPSGPPARASELAGTYRPLQVPRTTHDRFLVAAGTDAVEVSVADDGALLLDDGSEQRRWVETGPLVFESPETGETLAFGEGDGEIRYLFLDGTPTALARVEWYEDAGLHGLVALAGLVGLASGWLQWSPAREDGETRRAWLASVRSDPRRLAALSVHAGSVAVLLFLALTLVYVSSAPLQFLTAPALPYRAAFALPMAGAVAAAGAVVAGVGLWRDGAWSLRRRLHYGLVAASLVVMTALLGYWNLLLPP